MKNEKNDARKDWKYSVETKHWKFNSKYEKVLQKLHFFGSKTVLVYNWHSQKLALDIKKEDKFIRRRLLSEKMTTF